jgi:hypothetical protein
MVVSKPGPVGWRSCEDFKLFFYLDGRGDGWVSL